MNVLRMKSSNKANDESGLGVRAVRRRWLVLSAVFASALVVVGVASTDDEPLDTYLGLNIRSSGTLVEDAELTLHDGCMYLSIDQERFIPYFNALTISFEPDTRTIHRLFGPSFGLEDEVSVWRGSLVEELPDATLIVRGHASVCEESSSGFALLD